jgi:predicted amidohydrolase
MMTRESFRISIAQLASIRGEVEHNLNLIAERVEQAKKAGARLVVFPELALTGYIVDPRFASLAVTLDSPTMDRLRKLADGIDIILGLIEETPTSMFYNSAVHLSQGEILHLHRKIYLPTYGLFDERRYYGPGWDVTPYDTGYIRTAMLICGDAWHLPLAHLAAHGGADLLVIPAASSQEGLADTTPTEDAWRSLCRTYALTLSSFVVFANMGEGEEDEYTFLGGSFVAGPDGQILAESSIPGDDLVTCELDPRALRQQRIRLPFRRDDSLAHTVELARRTLNAKIRSDYHYAGSTPPLTIPPKPK